MNSRTLSNMPQRVGQFRADLSKLIKKHFGDSNVDEFLSTVNFERVRRLHLRQQANRPGLAGKIAQSSVFRNRKKKK